MFATINSVINIIRPTMNTINSKLQETLKDSVFWNSTRTDSSTSIHASESEKCLQIYLRVKLFFD